MAPTKIIFLLSFLVCVIVCQPDPPTFNQYSLALDYSFDGGQYVTVIGYYDGENNRSRFDDITSRYNRIDDGKNVISVAFNSSWCETDCHYGKECGQEGACIVYEVINLFQYLPQAKYNGTCQLGFGLAYSANIMEGTSVVYCLSKELVPLSFVLYLGGGIVQGVLSDFSSEQPNAVFFRVPPQCPCFGPPTKTVESSEYSSSNFAHNFERFVQAFKYGRIVN